MTHVHQMTILCSCRAKHKHTLDGYIATLAQLKSIPKKQLEDPLELEDSIVLVQGKIKNGNEFMGRMLRLAEHYMMDSPLLNSMWKNGRKK